MAKNISPIIFGNWWRGQGTSKYDEAYFDDLTNADILTEVGTIRCNRSLVNDSDSSITSMMLMVPVPSGAVYMFSTTSGAIVRRDSVGYTNLTDNTNTTGHIGCGFYNGYVYYATATKLGRFSLDSGDPIDPENNRNDEFATFSVGDPLFHPMTVHNLKLFIGDGNKVVSVDNADGVNLCAMGAVGLESQFRITDLQRYGNDLLVLAGVSSYISNAGLFRWDTYSDSWTDEDYINEPYINYAIYSDTTDLVFISAGTEGNIYLYDGVKLSYYTNVPDSGQSIGSQLKCSFKRMPLFASSKKIYAIIAPQRSMAPAVVNVYSLSEGEDATIVSMVSIGNTILVAWGAKRSYGVDILSGVLATSSFTTPIVSNRKVVDVRIPFDSLPAECSITLEINTDNAGFVSKALIKDAADMNMYRLDGHIANHRSVQARVTLHPHLADTPVVPHIEFW
jgi:hypothetical protein